MRRRLAVALLVLAIARPAGAARELPSGARMRDCKDACPTLVVIPAGRFVMGADAGEPDRPEGPPHAVTIARPFALATHEVSNAEYERFLMATRRRPTAGCRAFDPATGRVDPNPASDVRHPGPGAGEGRPDMPAVCVSWTDARDYAALMAAAGFRDVRLGYQSTAVDADTAPRVFKPESDGVFRSWFVASGRA
ncbi:SUMF1/EgtB/PvdO family nonheme iron enzyme [Novosphingobium sp.]|uniref:SUMF1/EgtB/PvdO family nonheme iron enzyme n=1 Tax=Novosphingobium sp. TaxID=1874826 RepID=UPI0026263047|nr:SUMF1/EgtB/PvdO family nonheme iron enzyme [Novosphingobium sp.]